MTVCQVSIFPCLLYFLCYNYFVNYFMKRRKSETFKNIGIIVLILIVGVLVYLNFKNKNSDVANEDKSTIAIKEPIKNTETTINFSVKNLDSEMTASSINIDYPVLTSMKDTKIQSNINSQILASVNSIKSNFLKDLTDEMFGGNKNELNIVTPKVYLAKDVVNVEFEVSEYYSGAAHPNHYQYAQNFFILTGKKISLKNVFKTDENYLSLVSKTVKPLVEAKVKSLGFDTSMVSEGIKPTEENFKFFHITENGLVIIFNPYQVAPYVVGTLNITIPWASLNGHLNENFQ